MEIENIVKYIKEYDGPEIKIMEVCGTHTSSIFKSGIRSILSPKIKLISGPGCPVCVTPTAYIDKCVEYAQKESHVLMTFGDMMKVPGNRESLSEAKGNGAHVEIMYAPFETLEKAQEYPDKMFVLAAVGFETTAPSYALTIKEAKAKGIQNIKLLTALKTVIPALSWICENEKEIGGFLCPGHVSVIIGSREYEPLAARYQRPFTIAGFESEHILAGIYDIVRQVSENRQGTPNGVYNVHNLYTNAVKPEGNQRARQLLDECFEVGSAMWRGLGRIEQSGLYLSKDYSSYDGGSFGLDEDKPLPKDCQCGDVIVGRINPDQCPMFQKSCSPAHPYGPCMVSAEGACGVWYRHMGLK